MVWNVFAWWFNHVDRTRERALYAELHRKLYDEGYKNQLSFYGTLSKPYDDKHVQARIEIMTKNLITKFEMHVLVDMMKHYLPDREYTLFLFKELKLIQVIPQ